MNILRLEINYNIDNAIMLAVVDRFITIAPEKNSKTLSLHYTTIYAIVFKRYYTWYMVKDLR